MGIICYASHIICSPEDTVPETGYRYPRKARHDTAERVAHAGARGRDRRMKLTIFAATGGVGRHLVGQAIAAGHDVTAGARKPPPLPPEGPAGTAHPAPPRP